MNSSNYINASIISIRQCGMLAQSLNPIMLDEQGEGKTTKTNVAKG